VINLFAHLSILVAFAVLTYYSIAIILRVPTPLERNLRALALIAGFFAFWLARAAGLSLPEVLFRAIAVPAFVPVRLALQVAVPGVTGGLTARFFLRAMQTGENEVRIRYMLAINALFVLMFADVYAAAFAAHPGTPLNPLLLPNGVFVLAIILYILKDFRVHRRRPALEENLGSRNDDRSPLL
jgi:hypothetical protein